MAMIDSQQIDQITNLLGKFGGNQRDSLSLPFFQFNWYRNNFNFYQIFYLLSKMLKMHTKNDWEVLVMQLSPTQ